jgi:hypothetical protein
MLDNLTIKFGHSVSVGVAVIDHSVKVVQLTDLLLRVERRQVLCRHQIGAKGTATEANLSCRYWRYANHVGAVVHSAEDLEGATLSSAATSFSVITVSLDRLASGLD